MTSAARIWSEGNIWQRQVVQGLPRLREQRVKVPSMVGSQLDDLIVEFAAALTLGTIMVLKRN